MDSLYRENILEHFKNPRNYGKIKSPDIYYQGENQFCGDKINIYIKLDPKRTTIENISFTGEGCAISIASASMLFVKVTKNPISQINKLGKEDIVKMLGITLTVSRLKCALLSLEVLHKALHSAKIK